MHELLRQRGARVPDILMFEADPPELDRSAALTSHIPGIPLRECRDPVMARQVAIEAGRDLAIINTLPVTGFGWIDRIDETVLDGIIAQHPVRAGWTAEFFTSVKEISLAGLFDASFVARLGDTIHTWAGNEFETRSFLAHGDFDTSHIYYDPSSGTYTGIIDFGEGRGTHPTWDAGHLLLHDGEAGSLSVLPSILEGYGNPGDDFRYQMHHHAIAISARQLAIFLHRPNPAYRAWLAGRLQSLLDTPFGI